MFFSDTCKYNLRFSDIYDIINKKEYDNMKAVKDKFIKYEKKLHENATELSNDEEILYRLKEHVDSFTLNNLYLKIYFNTIDQSLSTDSKIWMNLIHTGFFPSYHCHDYYEFNVIFEGKCVEIVNGRVVNLNKGDILILPVNSAFHTHFLKDGGMGCNILVKSSYLATIRDEISGIKENFLDRLLKKNEFCIVKTATQSHITKDIEDLLPIYVKENKTQANSSPPSVLSRMFAESTFYRTILKICLSIENADVICEFSDTLQKTPSSEEIIMYVKNNYSNISMDVLSKHFGYSQRQLDRIIKKHTGKGFATLVTRERLIHAKNLLKNSSLSIAEISKITGLDSAEYFSNMFKKNAGMTPNEYRKMARNTGSKN